MTIRDRIIRYQAGVRDDSQSKIPSEAAGACSRSYYLQQIIIF